jgi:hypothetical protein
MGPIGIPSASDRIPRSIDGSPHRRPSGPCDPSMAVLVAGNDGPHRRRGDREGRPTGVRCSPNGIPRSAERDTHRRSSPSPDPPSGDTAISDGGSAWSDPRRAPPRGPPSPAQRWQRRRRDRRRRDALQALPALASTRRRQDRRFLLTVLRSATIRLRRRALVSAGAARHRPPARVCCTRDLPAPADIRFGGLEAHPEVEIVSGKRDE